MTAELTVVLPEPSAPTTAIRGARSDMATHFARRGYAKDHRGPQTLNTPGTCRTPGRISPFWGRNVARDSNFSILKPQVTIFFRNTDELHPQLILGV